MQYYGDYPTEQKRNRGDDPAVSVYLLNDTKLGVFEKISCMYCKRTIADVKGRIDKVIDSPSDPRDFGVAINIRCKLCHQNYRLIVSQTYIGVIV